LSYTDTAITVDSTNDVTSINVAKPSTFFTTTDGVPTKTFTVTYKYWKAGDTGTTKSGSLASNAFTVTQDCNQQPFAATAATQPSDIKFALTQVLAKGGAPTYTIFSSLKNQFVNSNCWAINKKLPTCTANNTSTAATGVSTTAKFAVVPSTVAGTYDFSVTATNPDSASDLSDSW